MSKVQILCRADNDFILLDQEFLILQGSNNICMMKMFENHFSLHPQTILDPANVTILFSVRVLIIIINYFLYVKHKFRF